MKRIFLIVLACSLILVFAKTSSAGTLSVSAKGTVRFFPKNAELNVRISSRGKTQKEVLSRLRAKINIIAKTINLTKTTYINITPVTVYDFNLHKTVNNGYEGWETADIKFKTGKLNKYVTFLLNVKNVQIQNIKYYDLSALKYKNNAIKKAFKKAMAKASMVLGLMGKKERGIESVKIVGQGAPSYRPLPFLAMGAAKEESNKYVFPGKIKVTENVYIEITY